MSIELDVVRERWVAEASDTDLGLWWLVDDLRDLLGKNASDRELRGTLLEALRPLLESGKLRVMTPSEGGAFDVWTGDVDRQLGRIIDGWKAVGEPDIGDVAWFIGERRKPC